MDIYQVLKKDHRTAKTLFSKLLNTSMEDRDREDIFMKLKMTLTSHHEAEKNIFYAALDQEENTDTFIENALEQHDEVEEIEAINLHDQDWQEKMMELQTSLKKHIKMEEGTLFKEAKRIFSDRQAKELAQEFMNAKEQAEIELLSRYT